MSDPRPHAIAADLILDRAREVDVREIHKRLEEFDLTADESEALADLVQELIGTADLTVEFTDVQEATQ